MKLGIQKGISVLLLVSAAGFFCLAIGGKHLGRMLFDRSSFAHAAVQLPVKNWSSDPDTLDLLKEFNGCLETSLAAVGSPARSAHRALLSVALGTSENVSALAGFISGQNPEVPLGSALVQAAAFWKYSFKYEVPLDLVVAVAHTESHFLPSARSGAGAAGIMQVMWRVHSGLLQANGIAKEEDLYDPDRGIAAGSLLISRYLKACGDTQTALGRYYGGSASVYWERVSRNLSKIRSANLLASSF